MSESLLVGGVNFIISAPSLMSLLISAEFIKMFSCSCCCFVVVVKPEAKICVSKYNFFLLTKGSVIYFLLRIFAMPHQNDWVR